VAGEQTGPGRKARPLAEGIRMEVLS
jgi:hypothetical protein